MIISFFFFLNSKSIEKCKSFYTKLKKKVMLSFCLLLLLMKIIKKANYLSSQAELVVCICNVVGRGLMLPWIPDKQAALQQQVQVQEMKKKRSSRNKNPVSSYLNVSSEAHEDLRYALKVQNFRIFKFSYKYFPPKNNVFYLKL